ncbi:PREDICTED: peroxisomal membrane protein PEX16-like [Amphimedon queenslandica]|uniref:Peroxisomal membrane protein PEX16 n=1 Tax=Amphimedon queenslandica TaxID=400682 RepID=A0A1X7SPR6_AMPQE|nr:PREDICTED: peroxisomal membrane protein PEX16-like [Amphimedon queenslandica]|eukprot:XP_011409059.1 PREDICTED: peroxisomal membrane protein PEX16-like [Amphimedon queenslandica]
MVLFQESSWKPWLVSLAMDVISLHLHGGLVHFKTSEPSEMLRRRLVLLLYLLRSPFYEKHTKALLFAFLQYIASHVPLTSWIIKPLVEYLPVWKDIYSYNWMS